MTGIPIRLLLDSQNLPPQQGGQLLFFFFFFFFYLFAFSRAAPVTYGDSQAKGQIGAVATGLHHSHSNSVSELRL